MSRVGAGLWRLRLSPPTSMMTKAKRRRGARLAGEWRLAPAAAEGRPAGCAQARPAMPFRAGWLDAASLGRGGAWPARALRLHPATYSGPRRRQPVPVGRRVPRRRAPAGLCPLHAERPPVHAAAVRGPRVPNRLFGPGLAEEERPQRWTVSSSPPRGRCSPIPESVPEGAASGTTASVGSARKGHIERSACPRSARGAVLPGAAGAAAYRPLGTGGTQANRVAAWLARAEALHDQALSKEESAMLPFEQGRDRRRHNRGRPISTRLCPLSAPREPGRRRPPAPRSRALTAEVETGHGGGAESGPSGSPPGA